MGWTVYNSNGNILESIALTDNSVSTAKIADDAVTAAKLANSINSEITANTAKVTNATHSGDVTGATALTIAANAVTTAKIADSQVTLAKLDNTARETNIQLVVIDFAIALTTGDGKFYFYVPATLNTFELVAVHGEVVTASAGEDIRVQLHNVKSSSPYDMLTGNGLVIAATKNGSDETGGSVTIDTSSNRDVLTTHDIIRVDINQVGSSTAGSGLIVNMTCRLP